MVDLRGRIDRGVPAGEDGTPETFVLCARNQGIVTMLKEAQAFYLSYACNSNAVNNVSRCPYQKACFTLHMNMLRDNVRKILEWHRKKASFFFKNKRPAGSPVTIVTDKG